MAMWEEQTGAMTDREDLGGVVVILLLVKTQCLTKCSLREAVFIWGHGPGYSPSWCQRHGSGTSSCQWQHETACSHLGESGRERDTGVQLALSFTLLNPTTWNDTAHDQSGSSSIFSSDILTCLYLTNVLNVS